jgi:hypothetical protein
LHLSGGSVIFSTALKGSTFMTALFTIPTTDRSAAQNAGALTVKAGMIALAGRRAR